MKLEDIKQAMLSKLQESSNFTHYVHMTKNGKPAGKIQIRAIDDKNAEFQAGRMHTNGAMNKPYRGYDFSHITKKDGSKLDESIDWAAEIKKAGEEIDKERGKKIRSLSSDDWTGSARTQVTDRSFADKAVGTKHKGSYGTSYVEPDEDEKTTKKVEPTSDAPKKRGRPAGAVGAAKRAAAAHGNDAGKTLQDFLVGKAPRTSTSALKKGTVKGSAQSGDQPESEEDKRIANDPAYDRIKKESIDSIIGSMIFEKVSNLNEMSWGATKSPSGKKVEWHEFKGLGHSVTVDGVSVHKEKPFVDRSTAAKLYATHIAQ